MRRKNKLKFSTPQASAEAFNEAKEYFQNSKEILKSIPIEWGAYKNPKKVKEASALAYLSTLRAIDGYLLKRGKTPSQLPTSFPEYMKALKGLPHDGKLMTALEIVYQNLHIFGYYRGGISVKMIKDGFQKAKIIIDTLSVLT
jgi:hypothetical protein